MASDTDDALIFNEPGLSATPLDEDERYHRLYRSHTRHLQKPPLARPLPYLDVLSLQSRQLISRTSAQIAAHEASSLKKYPPPRRHQPGASGPDDSCSKTSDLERLEDLLQSVHLLLEPIHIPDLSHTGVFDPSTSLLQPSGGSSSTTNTKLTLKSVEKGDEVKLFYPTGAKKANMREYIKETLQRHLASDTGGIQSCAQLSPATGSFDITQGNAAAPNALSSSASAPAIAPSLSSTSTPSSVPKSTKKPSKTSPSKSTRLKGSSTAKSPQHATGVAAAACGSPLLNPELTRQAKDIIAAIRANSSKINELMTATKK
uniref:Uncharacterized protein n=1 Tax=Globisporangium ultimum (strain ATCC 200006 / CBS 805.95 / DAOM BR144) TaxID=431595 RepID=K3WNH9_GLOUD